MDIYTLLGRATSCIRRMRDQLLLPKITCYCYYQTIVCCDHLYFYNLIVIIFKSKVYIISHYNNDNTKSMGKDTTLGKPRESVGYHNRTTGCEFAREVRSARERLLTLSKNIILCCSLCIFMFRMTIY